VAPVPQVTELRDIRHGPARPHGGNPAGLATAWMLPPCRWALPEYHRSTDSPFTLVVFSRHRSAGMTLPSRITNARPSATPRASASGSSGAAAVVITGGHGSDPVDHLFDGTAHLPIPVVRHQVAAARGSGCTHSAALAAGLAAGLPLADAARQAAGVAGDAVAHGLDGLGSGPGPVHVLHSGVVGPVHETGPGG
jgi:sugar/nucleoside kinase (ribokinase family)